MNYRGPTLMLFLGFSLQTAEAGMIDKEGMAPWEICGMCHGLDGNSHMSKFPKLAGQKAAYIVQQFNAFHNGQRTNDGGQMQAITEEVQAQDLASIAEHFESQVAVEPPAPTGDIERYRQGKALYQQGRPGLAACVQCHNPSQTRTPWLDAQHPAYLNKQLDDFRSGRRDTQSRTPMPAIAKALTPEEQTAVTHYLSRTLLRHKPPD
ncbi:MAG: c-type cytochrome [Pseudomonadota bacterium]|nr:c-type cytochrome [Pseudomonadota bacterium]